MKKLGFKLAGMALMMALFALAPKGTVQAAPDDTIPQGVTVAGMDLSGMPRDEATAAIRTYGPARGEKTVWWM